jgi:hypothetical protein
LPFGLPLPLGHDAPLPFPLNLPLNDMLGFPFKDFPLVIPLPLPLGLPLSLVRGDDGVADDCRPSDTSKRVEGAELADASL